MHTKGVPLIYCVHHKFVFASGSCLDESRLGSWMKGKGKKEKYLSPRIFPRGKGNPPPKTDLLGLLLGAHFDCAMDESRLE